MGWLLLALAIFVEVGGTTCMKLSKGFSILLPTILVFVFYSIAFTLLILVLKRMDLSMAYALWAGVGTALTVLVGIFYFKEHFTLIQMVGLGLIVLGVTALKAGH